MRKNWKYNIYASNSDVKTNFLERERIFFVYIVSPFRSSYMGSTCSAFPISPNVSMQEENVCLKVLEVELHITTSNDNS